MNIFNKQPSAEDMIISAFNQTSSGNIGIFNRPQYVNPDGKISTVRSIGINDGTNEILIPTISDTGKLLTAEEALGMYGKTGKHLGKFKNRRGAENYADLLHIQQQSMIEALKKELSK